MVHIPWTISLLIIGVAQQEKGPPTRWRWGRSRNQKIVVRTKEKKIDFVNQRGIGDPIKWGQGRISSEGPVIREKDRVCGFASGRGKNG